MSHFYNIGEYIFSPRDTCLWVSACEVKDESVWEKNLTPSFGSVYLPINIIRAGRERRNETIWPGNMSTSVGNQFKYERPFIDTPKINVF